MTKSLQLINTNFCHSIIIELPAVVVEQLFLPRSITFTVKLQPAGLLFEINKAGSRIGQAFLSNQSGSKFGMELSGFSIEPGERGQGYATALLFAIAMELSQRKCNSFCGWIDDENTAARAFVNKFRARYLFKSYSGISKTKYVFKTSYILDYMSMISKTVIAKQHAALLNNCKET